MSFNRRKKRREIDRAEEDVLVGVMVEVIADEIQQQEEEEEEESSDDERPIASIVRRQRKKMDVLIREIGPAVFKKMYRMHVETFYRLYDLLEPSLVSKKRQSKGHAPNGNISNLARLSMALRFFAGGDKYDISALHGVHPQEVYRSVWRVVDAVFYCDALHLCYPTDHEKQEAMAQRFKEKSGCDFNNCVGCVDGMLVWTNMPSEDPDEIGCGLSLIHI